MYNPLLSRHESEHALETTIQKWTQLAGETMNRSIHQTTLLCDITFSILFLSITRSLLYTEYTLYDYVITVTLYYQIYISHLLYCSRFIVDNIIFKCYFIMLTILTIQCSIHISYNNYSMYSILCAGGIRLLLSVMYTYSIYRYFNTKYISLYYVCLNLLYAILLVSSIGLHNNDRYMMYLSICIIDIIQTILFGLFVSPTSLIDSNKSHITYRLYIQILSIIPLTSAILLYDILPPYIDSLKPYDLLPNIEPSNINLSINHITTAFLESNNTDNNNTLHLSTLYGYITISVLLLYSISLLYNNFDTHIHTHHAFNNGVKKSLIFLYSHIICISGICLLCMSIYYTSQSILAHQIDIYNNNNDHSNIFKNDSNNDTNNQTSWSTLLDSSNIAMNYGISFIVFSYFLLTQLHIRNDYELTRCIDCSLSNYMYIPVHTLLNIWYYTIESLLVATFVLSLLFYYIFHYLTNETQYNIAYYQLWTYCSILSLLAILTCIRHSIISHLIHKHNEYHEFSLEDVKSFSYTHDVIAHTKPHTHNPNTVNSNNNTISFQSPLRRSAQHTVTNTSTSNASLSEHDLYQELQRALISSNTKNKNITSSNSKSTNNNNNKTSNGTYGSLS